MPEEKMLNLFVFFEKIMYTFELKLLVEFDVISLPTSFSLAFDCGTDRNKKILLDV